MRGDDVEPVVGSHPRREFLGERHVAADHRLERFDALAADREPQLDRPHPPSERDLPVAVVDHGAGFRLRRTQELGQDAQCPEQRAPVDGPEQIAVEVHAHPLVRVRAVGVDPVEPGVDPSQLGHEGGDARHRRIDVQPHVLAFADRSDLGCRIERHRRRGAVGRAHEERHAGRRRGRRRSSLRGRRVASRRSSSCGTMRMRSVPIPAMRRPFSMPECAWAVAYATSREVSPSVLTAPSVARQRAARIATSTASLAEPWITPPPCSLVERNRSGRSSSSIIQSSISVSSSVHAGEVTQLMPCTPSPADSSSPRIDEYDVFAGK